MLFAFAAAVPPLKDEKFCEAELREPPLPHGFATRLEMPGAQLEARSARLLVLSNAPRGDSALGVQPPRLDRGRCNRTCTQVILMQYARMISRSTVQIMSESREKNTGLNPDD